MKESREYVSKLNEFEIRSYKIGMEVQQKIITEAVVDTRVSTFYMLAQLLRSFKIYLILKYKYLEDRQWYVDEYLLKWGQQWPVTGGKYGVIHNDQEVLNRDFDQVMLVGYTQTLFSIVESHFRLFTISIDPTACKNGTDIFYKIRRWLLREINKETYEQFLKFFSNIRNTIHNNGIHTRATCKEGMLYKEKLYNFEQGKPVELGNSLELLLLKITPDVIDMMKDIILNSQKVISIPSIPDPMGSL